MLKKLKNKLYVYLVDSNQDVKKHYESYKISNSEFHEKHRIKSFLFLHRLRKYYKNGQKGAFPTPPKPYSLISAEKSTLPQKPLVSSSPRREIKPKQANSDRKQIHTVLPYLDGSESAIYNIGKEHFFARSLLNYDVISFDIFDTLIFRPFVSPKDLFLLLQHTFDYLDFANIRVEAERKAKDICMMRKGHRNITIDDIYEIIERQTGIPKDYGVKVEFETELELCFPNPYMQRVYKLLKAQGKTIIAVSDMYFSVTQMKTLLNKCGYDWFDEVYISCEHNADKTSGDLYKIVSSHLKPNTRICHIGDNYEWDIKNARKNGWDAKHYRNINERGNKYRATFAGMSELTGSAYGGIVNSHLLNCSKVYPASYEYGFLYGGLYVFGYCNWIHEYAVLHGIDKILFISRDGAIYQKVFNLLFDDIKNEYVYWSRLVCARLVAEKDKNDFILRIVKHRKNDIYPISVGSLLSMLGLDELSEYLSEYKLSCSDPIVNSNSAQIENFFIDKWDEIISIFNREKAAEQYYKKIIGDSKRVAVVDIGWQGSGLLGIKWLIEKKWQLDCKVSCLLAGSKALSFTANLPELLDKKLEVYMFSRNYNRDMFDYFAHSNKHTNTGHFELFTQAQCPTFSNFYTDENNKPKFEFGIPETENYEKINQIHNGIYDFCRIYKERFKKYQFLYNISGYDAIIPFRHITRDPKFIKEQLGDMTFSRNICADFNRPYLETIKDVMIRQELVKG